MAQTLTIAPTPASRILGLLGVIGGLGLLFAFVAESLFIQVSPDWFNLRLVLFNIGAIAVVVAAHARQSAAGPRLCAGGRRARGARQCCLHGSTGAGCRAAG